MIPKSPKTTKWLKATYTDLIKYRFLGQPDWRFPKLKHGKVYRLVIVKQPTWVFSSKPHIVYPFMCPYSSWKTFYQNWREII